EHDILLGPQLTLRNPGGLALAATIDAEGAGRHLQASGPTVIEGLRFIGGHVPDNATAVGGGSLLIQNCGQVVIRDCQFQGNYAPWRGGALYVANSLLTLLRCDFSADSIGFNSQNGSHGGAVFSSGGTVVATECTFV